MQNIESPSPTDDNLSFVANEFTWADSNCTKAQTYLGPPTVKILRKARSRTVLDLGCGNGAFTNMLKSLGFEITGCDVSSTGISLAQTQFPRIPFFHYDITNQLPAEHIGRYDAVVSTEVIEHLLLPRALVRSALSALRPGGLFVISTPFHGYWKNLALALTNSFDEHWHPCRDFGHVKFFSKKTLLGLVQEQGFQTQEFRLVGRIPLLACSMILVGIKPTGVPAR